MSLDRTPETDVVNVTPNEFGPDTRDDYQVLKFDDLFAVFGENGCINDLGTGPPELHCKDGLFLSDTRVLSRLRLTLCGTELTLQKAHKNRSGTVFNASLANARLIDEAGREVSPYAIHLRRRRFLSEGLHDRIWITNHSTAEVRLDLVFDLWADFRDIFEIRGLMRQKRGHLHPPVTCENGFDFTYDTLDDMRMTTRVRFDRDFDAISGRAHFHVALTPGQTDCISLEVRAYRKALGDVVAEGVGDQDRLCRHVEGVMDARRQRLGGIKTDNADFNAWLAQAGADLAMLTTEMETGPYPFAGTPWFSAPFGRDALITTMQVQWREPKLARGVLAFLARTQAVRHDEASEAEPGKILHEARDGEMARRGEVPFGQYYGGIDQTLLFVILARDHLRRTGDLAFAQSLLPHVDAALDWAFRYGDADGCGFIEYRRRGETGLLNQGWKDSDDAVFHADGSRLDGAIALIEVQGYWHDALRAGAELYRALGDPAHAGKLEDQAQALAARIDEAFWSDDLGLWALALDGEKRPALVRTSNAGHLLFSDAARPERIGTAVESLTARDMLAEWGLRTVSERELAFNPMGYHTGSIWPHDTAIVAAGLARRGAKTEARKLTAALLRAATGFTDFRLPELYCGFAETDFPSVVAYPSACSPQAWAAGAPFLCLSSLLGLEIDPRSHTVTLRDPILPEGVSRLSIDDLEVGPARVTLDLCDDGDGIVACHNPSQDGIDIEILPAH